MKKIINVPIDVQQNIQNYMPENQTLQKLADFFTVFADATRVKIMTALTLGPMCVNDLSVLLNINQTTLSHQLKFLKQNNAVDSIRQGKIIYYKVDNSHINDVMLYGVEYLLSTKYA